MDYRKKEINIREYKTNYCLLFGFVQIWRRLLGRNVHSRSSGFVWFVEIENAWRWREHKGRKQFMWYCGECWILRDPLGGVFFVFSLIIDNYSAHVIQPKTIKCLFSLFYPLENNFVKKERVWLFFDMTTGKARQHKK